jgi:uncharacterized membrane protein
MASGPTPMPTSLDNRIVAFGRACYGLGIAGLGFQFFVNRAFVAVVLPTMPAPPYWTAVTGAALVLAGLVVAAGWKARGPALLLGAALLAAFVLGQVPSQLPNWKVAGGWTTPLKTLTLAGGAWICAATLAGPRAADPFLRTCGRLCLGFTLLFFGFEHFLYPGFVAGLVPSWIPGHLFWTYFAGGALMAGGLGLLTGIAGRLAGGLSGLMIFIWLIVLHLPRAVADPTGLHGNEVSSVFEALAFAGLGFILGRTLPKKARPA